MSSVDLSDPHISMAHDALVQNDPLRWFLLAYGSRPNLLVLWASGTGDLDELRTHLTENVCYGVFREQTQDKFFHVAINYIPDSVKGVWRARALVHGKAVSSAFKVHQGLDVSNPDQVTVQAIRSLLRLPPRVPQSATPVPLSPLPVDSSNILSITRKSVPELHSDSLSSSPPRRRPTSPPYDARPPFSSLLPTQPLPAKKQALPSIDTSSPSARNGPSSSTIPSSATGLNTPLAKISTALLSRSVTNSTPSQSPLAVSPVPVRSGNWFHTTDPPLSPQHASRLEKPEPPLPTLPSPSNLGDDVQDAEWASLSSEGHAVLSHIGSIPDSSSVASLHTSDRAPSPVPPSPSHNPHDSRLPTRPTDRQFNHPVDGLPVTSLSSPPTASKVIDHTDTDQSAAEDPASFPVPKQVRSRFQERAKSPADEEEERKLLVLEEERRRRAVERARREKEAREAEEAREREFEMRKEQDKKRRLESARRAEERRAEQKRQQEEEKARQKAEKERKEMELQQRRSHIKQRFEKQAGMDLLSGFITLESSSSWKRRYYRLSTEDWNFFKSDEDTTVPVYAIELGRVRALREWHEGYDELEAIPNSFAVELKDDSPCLFFADSAEDKEILLGLLNQAAGL
ncbi:hypothetical protein JB92DRAFT_2881364 [Gautieria morchelliformis]|nr:hypothetical protein JB92DRAFT_2881364 [Gautieria morchelliformis]